MLFDSELVNERDMLKNILHKLYAKLVPRRKLIRKAITDLFQLLIHDIHKFNGASELLDILAAIISGFAVPLREEHSIFFKNIIIPLHKVQTSFLYYDNLVRCSLIFLSKDSSLSIPLIEGLLRYWPFANSSKEAHMILELGEVLEFVDIDKIKSLVPKLFKKLVKCFSGSQCQISDYTICLFERECFINLLTTYKSITFPIVVPAVCRIANTHWHKAMKESFSCLQEILSKLDKSLYEANSIGPDDPKRILQAPCLTQTVEDRIKIDTKWKSFLNIAKTKNPKFVSPTVPYREDTILSEFNRVYKDIYNKTNIY